jgi:hypothetical protein
MYTREISADGGGSDGNLRACFSAGAELLVSRRSLHTWQCRPETEAETHLGTKPESPLESDANRLRVARGGSKSAGSRPLEVGLPPPWPFDFSGVPLYVIVAGEVYSLPNPPGFRTTPEASRGALARVAMRLGLDGKATVLIQHVGTGCWGVPSPEGHYLAYTMPQNWGNLWAMENFQR